MGSNPVGDSDFSEIIYKYFKLLFNPRSLEEKIVTRSLEGGGGGSD